MHRSLPFTVLIIIAALVIALVWVSNRLNRIPTPEPVASEVKPPPPAEPTASQHLLVGYGDPAAEPTEDLRKLHRVTTGYFSVIKDPGRFPIGGNAAAAGFQALPRGVQIIAQGADTADAGDDDASFAHN